MQVSRRLFLLSIAILGCVPKPAPPEAVPVSEIAERESNPRRAASLRLVEQGRLELEQSRYERAALRFSGAIEIDHQNPYAYFYLGVARFRSGRFTEAADLFQRAATLFSGENAWKADSLAWQGESFEQLKRFDDARKAFQAALEVQGGNPRAKEGLLRISQPM